MGRVETDRALALTCASNALTGIGTSEWPEAAQADMITRLADRLLVWLRTDDTPQVRPELRWHMDGPQDRRTD